MRSKIHSLLSALCLLCFGCDPATNPEGGGKSEAPLRAQSSEVISNIEIEGVDDLTLNGVGGRSYSQTEAFVDSIVEVSDANPIVIDLRVGDYVQMGYVKEVKEIIRKHHKRIIVQYSEGERIKYVRLPPLSNEGPDLAKISNRNLYAVHLDASGILAVTNRDRVFTSLHLFTKEVRRFLVSDTTDNSLPQLAEKDIPWFGNTLTASSSVVALTTDYEVPFVVYQGVYTAIGDVYYGLYDELSNRQFGAPFVTIDQQKQAAIKGIYPFVVAELDQSGATAHHPQ